MKRTSDRRQNNQLQLAFMAESRSEAPRGATKGTEALAKDHGTESPAIPKLSMEEVVERENGQAAWEQGKANQGGPGIDGRTVEELPEYLVQHWPVIREQWLNGTYKPQPVERKEIDKSEGAVRQLGIPCVLDRFIQPAVRQVRQRDWDPTFSEHS
jgi:RNA-directed DNA polymerase